MPADSPHIRILGTAQILISDGGSPEVEALLAQRKRLGMLGYLAAMPRGRWVPRQDLLFHFWPELDETRARKACSQTLWVLRQALGEEALEKRGYSAVRLAPDGVDVDMWRFQEAVSDGSDEAVVGLYGGELLAGLTLREAPAFERWLDEQRSFTSRTARNAAWRLAEAAGEGGDLREAVRLNRWAFQTASRYDEGALRRLMQALADAGDRRGVADLYRAFERELGREGEAPHPETVELARRLTGNGTGDGGDTRPGAAATSAAPPSRIASADRAPESDPAVPPRDAGGLERAGEPGPGPASSPERRARWGLIALLALVVVAALVDRTRDPAPGSSPENLRVAVLPFEVRGPTELSYLGPAMSDLITARLDGVARLRGIDPTTVRSVAPGPGEDPRRVARALGGDHVIAGSIVATGTTLELQARMYDVRGVEVAVARVPQGEVARLSALMDSLALRLVRSWLSGQGAALDYGAAEETPSLGALKAYLEGEEAFRRFDLEGAVVAFEDAVRQDSTFALAHFRLSRVGDWLNDGRLTGSLDRAAEHADRLPRRQRRLLEAYREFWQGSVPAGTLALETLVADYPGDAEAWFQLGEARFHGGPRIGSSILEAEADFRRAHALAPRDPRPLLHLLALAALRGDEVESRRLAQLLPTLDALRRFQIFALSNPRAPIADFERALRELPTSLLPGSTLSAADMLGRPDLMDLAGRLILEADSPPQLAVQGHMLRALAAEARGEAEVADSVAGAVGQLDPGLGRELGLYLQALPWRDVGASIRPAVASCGTPTELAAVAILAARQGAWSAVDSATFALDRTTLSNQEAALPVVVAAEAALARNQPEEALRLLETYRAERSALHTFATSVTFPHAYERLLRARILEALDRPDAALRWYSTIPAVVSYSLPFQAPALQARQRILASLGRHEEGEALAPRLRSLRPEG